TRTSRSRPAVRWRCPTCRTPSASGRPSGTRTPRRSSSARSRWRTPSPRPLRRPTSWPASPDRAMNLRRPPYGEARRRVTAVLGRRPAGLPLVAPYVVFLAAVFASPFGFAVWISFHDYFFTAPGTVVERPFVGFDNYVAVLNDPAVRQAFGNIVVFLLINVPL